jgi:transcriptional regulator with XRE-family HTH domain
MDAKKVFAANLKAAMDYRKLTQGDIHRRTGIAQSTVGRVVRMAQAPDLDTVGEIARAVGFHPWQLLVPTFKPDSPPFLPRLTADEQALYDKLKAALSGQK